MLLVVFMCFHMRVFLEEIVESLIGMTMTLVLVEDLVHEGSFDKLLKFACNENPELLVECVVQLGT